MSMVYLNRSKVMRPAALLLSALLTCPLLASCGGGGDVAAPPPPASNVRGGAQDVRGGAQTNQAARPANRPQVKKGLSNTQKVAITLAGAAALYYLYNQHKNKQGEGAQGKYYLSKNGRVYYRDANKKVVWVTPPSGGIQVPQEEAQQYRDFKGYNNSPTGRELSDLAPAQAQ